MFFTKNIFDVFLFFAKNTFRTFVKKGGGLCRSAANA